MKVFKVVGFGMLIIMLKFLVPHIFAGLENTLLVFLDVLQGVLLSGKEALTAGVIQPL